MAPARAQSSPDLNGHGSSKASSAPRLRTGLELAQQATNQYEDFSEEKQKKRRIPRRTVWPDMGNYEDMSRYRPQDPTLLQRMIYHEQQREAMSPGGAKLRPQSAPSLGAIVGKAQRPLSSSANARKGLRTKRPVSAPRLDGGLLEKRPHSDSFLQQIEDLAVRQNITRLKSERLAEKAAVAHIDIMHDTSLFDLKVLHNASARKRTEKIRQNEAPAKNTLAESGKGQNARGAAAGVHRVGPRHPNWRELTVVDQMRNLCHVVDMDLRLTTGQVQVFMMKAAKVGDGDVDMALAPEPDPPKEAPAAQKPCPMSFANFGDLNVEGQKKRFRATNLCANANPEMARITVNLLEFLLDRCNDLSEFFRLIDGRKKGQVSRREWETALMALGYVSDDPSRFFRWLDADTCGELACEDLAETLESQYPTVISRRLAAEREASLKSPKSPKRSKSPQGKHRPNSPGSPKSPARPGSARRPKAKDSKPTGEDNGMAEGAISTQSSRPVEDSAFSMEPFSGASDGDDAAAE